MKRREPWSRTPAVSVDRFNLQAMTSGNTQDAKAHQKMKAKIGPAENGKGLDCILVYTFTLIQA